MNSISKKLPEFSFTRAQFAQDFRFGTATSSYQIEGSDFGSCGASHWDEFCKRKGAIADQSNGSIACDHYNQLEQDLDLIAGLNMDSYRFSFSWPRLFPEGIGSPNQEGFDFYDRLIDGLLERNIEPWGCLYHWDLPQTLAANGGWANGEITDWFAQHAIKLVEHFGSRLTKIATLNEPWCIAWLGYFTGQHAPGISDIKSYACAMHNLLNAHATASEAIEELMPGKTGLIINLSHIIAATDAEVDLKSAAQFEAFHNRWFLEAIFNATYPGEALAVLEPYLPSGWQNDLVKINKRPDWLGINYYACECIENNPAAHFPSWRPSKNHKFETTPMGWAISPEGLTKVLKSTAETYTDDLPLYVTENGMGTFGHPEGSLEDTLNDHQRIQYIDAHLGAILSATDAGVPVKGYFVWSLMDNFEWSQGYGPRFGLYHVDFDSGVRRPKRSANEFAKFLATRR